MNEIHLFNLFNSYSILDNIINANKKYLFIICG